MGALDPNKDQKRAGKRRGQALSKRLGRKIELQDLEQVSKAVATAVAAATAFLPGTDTCHDNSRCCPSNRHVVQLSALTICRECAHRSFART